MARRVEFPIPDSTNQVRKIAVLRKQLESVQQNTGIQTELLRMLLVKTKLESLCLKLQKYSKAVVDESRLRAKEEEQRENFQCSDRLQGNNELSAKLRFKDLLNNTRREKEFEKQQSLRTMTSRGRGNNVTDVSRDYRNLEHSLLYTWLLYVLYIVNILILRETHVTVVMPVRIRVS